MERIDGTVMQNAHKYILLAILLTVFTGCQWVDEDMRDCETDYHLDYELRLVTNITTELETQISTQVELTSVAEALKEHLGGIFSDFAHDVNLSFYDVQGDSLLLHNESHIMDANQSSYTLYIPVRQYMHVAVANLQPTNPDGTPAPREVELVDAQKCHTSHLDQPVNNVKNVIKSQNSGIFSARMPMDIQDGKDQHFDVKLYMANCASAIALDTLGSGVQDVKVYASGFANGFNLADSTYYFNFTPLVEAEEVKVEDKHFVCFCAVTFPSKDVEESKTVIDSDNPYVSTAADEALWNYTIYTTCADGTITETLLGVKLPLRSGQFKLINAKIQADGSVTPREPYVGASVCLNWNDQPAWEIDF